MGLCGNGVLIGSCCDFPEGIGGILGVMGFGKDLLGEWYGGVVSR